MIIDLSEWNEYIADDVPPGAIPYGIKLETMQIITANGYRKPQSDDFPSGLIADPDSLKCRLFWRELK